MPQPRRRLAYNPLLLVILALTTGPASGMTENNRIPGDRAMAALDTCIADVFSGDADPASRDRIDLTDACPHLIEDVRAAARDTPLGGWAAANLTGVEVLTTGELLDLRALVATTPRGAELEWTQNQERLAALLDEVLVVTEQQQLGWWERFLEWLRDLAQTDGDLDLDWLEDLLQAIDFTEETVDGILYALLALAFGAVVALVLFELRAAGLFRQRTRGSAALKAAKRPKDTMPWGPDRGAKRTLTDIGALPRRRQPAAILGLCIQELVARGLLPDDRSRTNQELVSMVGRDQAAGSFAGLVRVAEETSYGGYPVTNQSLARCFSAARELLESR